MGNAKEALSRATLKILKPLVRLLLRNGISHGEFSEIARQAFVQVGFDDFKIDSQKPTTSRVSVLTGLSRKEVSRISKQLPDPRITSQNAPLNRASRVISGWLRDPEFSNSKRKPAGLPRYGEKSSFAALVARYSGDITAGAIYDELIRVGAIRQDQNLIHLCNEAYIPRSGIDEKVQIMGTSVSDLLETIDYNLVNHNHLKLQRQMVYHSLTAEVVDEFKQLCEQKSNNLLQELNQWLAQKKERLPIQSEIEFKHRAGIGIYFISNEIGKEK